MLTLIFTIDEEDLNKCDDDQESQVVREKSEAATDDADERKNFNTLVNSFETSEMTMMIKRVQLLKSTLIIHLFFHLNSYKRLMVFNLI